jgi:hypothetical protein
MDIRAKIRQALREQYGEFDTHLENIYAEKVTDNLASGSKKNKEAWSTYNQVVLELKHSIKDNLKVKELQYKLTDEFNPNEVCIEVIKDIKNPSLELERLYIKIMNFI